MLLSARMDEPEAKRRFASSSAERQKIVADAVPKKKEVATELWIRAFSEYCCSVYKGHVNLSTVSSLESFYVDVRTKNGSNQYSRSSLFNARSAM